MTDDRVIPSIFGVNGTVIFLVVGIGWPDNGDHLRKCIVSQGIGMDQVPGGINNDTIPEDGYFAFGKIGTLFAIQRVLFIYDTPPVEVTSEFKNPVVIQKMGCQGGGGVL